MKRYQTILVGAALDDRDATTMRHAARFAQAAESKSVYVAHVAASFDLPEGTGQAPAESVLPVDEEIDKKLTTLVEQQRNSFPAATVFHPVERQGSLAHELIRLAAQKSADLVCIGRRPPQAHDRLSEAAMQLVRQAPCSVLVVPPEAETRYHRILVPIDFSEHAREAVEVACAIAQSMPGVTVTVLNVYQVPLGWHKSPHSYEEFAAIMKGHAERHWHAFLPRINTCGVPLSVRFELGDTLAKTIVDIADKIDASLVVVGSHGRTLPAAFLLGHVADTVCIRTARPVLCVKKKGEMVNLLHAILQVLQLEDE